MAWLVKKFEDLEKQFREEVARLKQKLKFLGEVKVFSKFFLFYYRFKLAERAMKIWKAPWDLEDIIKHAGWGNVDESS